MKNEKHISEIAPVVLWQSIFNQHRHETDGFTLKLDNLPDAVLVSLRPVSTEFMAYVNTALQIVHKKHHPEIKNAIAYLNCLQELQAAAWQRTIQQGDALYQVLQDAIHETDPKKRRELSDQYIKMVENGKH